MANLLPYFLSQCSSYNLPETTVIELGKCPPIEPEEDGELFQIEGIAEEEIPPEAWLMRMLVRYYGWSLTGPFSMRRP